MSWTNEVAPIVCVVMFSIASIVAIFSNNDGFGMLCLSLWSSLGFGFLIFSEYMDKENNVLTCKDFGKVTKVNCAVEHGNKGRVWTRCRVEVNKEKVNLDYNLLVMEGDVLEVCTNSVPGGSRKGKYYRIKGEDQRCE